MLRAHNYTQVAAQSEVTRRFRVRTRTRHAFPVCNRRGGHDWKYKRTFTIASEMGVRFWFPVSMYRLRSTSRNSKTRYNFLIRMYDVEQPGKRQRGRGREARNGVSARGPAPATFQTYLTTFSSFNSLSRLISRMAVLGTPSSSASSLIFFRATTSPVVLSLALYTTPYVPARVP